MVFLERDIKTRKHTFGIQIYDILSMNNASTCTSEIQKAFEECQNDIMELERKVSSKREEMDAIGGVTGGCVGGGSGVSGQGQQQENGKAEMECGIPPSS
jgi:hypothetical protein|eukprot:scaffold3240_cov197-Alexandrium_tamarense.AAC.11